MNFFKGLTVLLLMVLYVGKIWAADPVKINGVTYSKSAQSGGQSLPDSNSDLALKKIFLFPSLDDLNGILQSPIDDKISALFRKNSRFELVRDAQVIKALAPDDSAYAKAALSSTVHQEALRVTGADATAIVRSKSVGNQNELLLEIRNSKGDLIFSEAGSIPGFSPLQAKWSLLDKLFNSFVDKIPFDTSVTGRTAKTITLDLGQGSVQNGDEVMLVRLVSLQKHPLLKTIVGSDYVRVGRARITSVERSLSFAEILEEQVGESISTGTKGLVRKSTGIDKYEAGAEALSEVKKLPPKEEDRLRGDFDDAKPRFGKIVGFIGYGSLTTSQAASGGVPQEISGSGLGAGVEGEAWITKNWILMAGYSFQSANLSGMGIDAGSSSWKRAELFAGYRLYPDPLSDVFSITGALGYQTQTYSIPNPSGTTISGKKFSGIALRVSGDIKLGKSQEFSGAFGLQPFGSLLDQSASPGTPDGSNSLFFQLGWGYRLSVAMWTKLNLYFDSSNGTYLNGSTVTNKRFAIAPSLYYSF